jgi:hypothetical protein
MASDSTDTQTIAGTGNVMVNLRTHTGLTEQEEAPLVPFKHYDESVAELQSKAKPTIQRALMLFPVLQMAYMHSEQSLYTVKALCQAATGCRRPSLVNDALSAISDQRRVSALFREAMEALTPSELQAFLQPNDDAKPFTWTQIDNAFAELRKMEAVFEMKTFPVPPSTRKKTWLTPS